MVEGLGLEGMPNLPFPWLPAWPQGALPLVAVHLLRKHSLTCQESRALELGGPGLNRP